MYHWIGVAGVARKPNETVVAWQCQNFWTGIKIAAVTGKAAVQIRQVIVDEQHHQIDLATALCEELQKEVPTLYREPGGPNRR